MSDSGAHRRWFGMTVLLCCCLSLAASPRDTVYVSGGVQHDGLLKWKDGWGYLSNSYLDLSVHYLNDSNTAHFRSLRASTRLELTQWPLPGYEADFKGYGMSHLSVEAAFDWGDITIGDVYAQFGSGLVLNLYEDRAMGIDGTLRGAKISANPVKGLYLTALGGKQRRYWNCYRDHAFGWNYTRDAALGGDAEIHIEEWSRKMRELDMRLSIGGSYVSKYEAEDTVITPIDGTLYRYNLPRWVGAGEVRAQWQMRGWDVLVEYARKANDPAIDNNFSYRDGEALLVSASYSRKGLAILAQMKHSDNMSFRSERLRKGIAGRLNHMPAFAQQHTYTLASLYPYATQYAHEEWAFQAEMRYTWARKTKMGGRYGTALRLNAAHIRGKEGENYTDVNLELNKRITKNWWLNAMLMYQSYNRLIVEGEGGLVRSGIAVLDARVHINNNVSMRGELQYLYTPHYQGQWLFALYELSLYKCLTVSAQWLYNIGYAPEAANEHFYTATVTYTNGAHRLTAGYTKTRDGYNCSGGICRYVPRQEGVTLSYNFTW
ncbi:MAG: hypothetical protein IJQ06_07750 [Paludibacteraceae bacterium]|nr:hypothetical protein [Paludibacteraceae bacterium]